MALDYDSKFQIAIEKLTEWYNLSYENEKAQRNALRTNYKKTKLDPDGYAIRYVNSIPCTADALLSINRICCMEKMKILYPHISSTGKNLFFIFQKKWEELIKLEQ